MVARENGCPWNKCTCSMAANGGHLEVLQWAHDNGCPLDALTCKYAAMGGHLEMMQWLRANGCPWDHRTCTNAAEGGHLEVLQWLHARTDARGTSLRARMRRWAGTSRCCSGRSRTTGTDQVSTIGCHRVPLLGTRARCPLPPV